MTQATFVARRSATWETLEALLARVDRRGTRSLSTDEILELGSLYRGLTSDLAYAQGHDYGPGLIEYLNRCVARAHARVYERAPATGVAAIRYFYARGFPSEFRASLPYIALCTALTLACAVIAYVLVRNHPADVYALLPNTIVPDTIRKSLHDSNFAVAASSAPEMSATIITNNVKVAIIAFAGSATLGVLTIYIIGFNGLMLGAVAALFTNAGFGYDFWATIAPHGFIELLAIQIAGAAGLLVVAGAVAPGRQRRRDALVANARRAGALVLGVASMLVCAGTIEAFVSPRRLPPATRLEIGLLTAVGLTLYFAFAGRKRPTATPGA